MSSPAKTTSSQQIAPDKGSEKPKPLSAQKASYQDLESLTTTRNSSSSSSGAGVLRQERAKTSIDSSVFDDLNSLSLSFKKSAPQSTSDKMYKSRETRRSSILIEKKYPTAKRRPSQQTNSLVLPTIQSETVLATPSQTEPLRTNESITASFAECMLASLKTNELVRPPAFL